MAEESVQRNLTDSFCVGCNVSEYEYPNDPPHFGNFALESDPRNFFNTCPRMCVNPSFRYLCQHLASSIIT
jgi:hypothetical protein